MPGGWSGNAEPTTGAETQSPYGHRQNCQKIKKYRESVDPVSRYCARLTFCKVELTQAHILERIERVIDAKFFIWHSRTFGVTQGTKRFN